MNLLHVNDRRGEHPASYYAATAAPIDRFPILKGATKADVKEAVEQLFSVQVEAVNMVNLKGKTKAFRQRNGTRSNKRKAYVRLGEGQSIDVMAKA